MTEADATTTNIAGDYAYVGVQAGTVHNVHLYTVSPDASPQEKFETGVHNLEGLIPGKARQLIREAVQRRRPDVRTHPRQRAGDPCPGSGAGAEELEDDEIPGAVSEATVDAAGLDRTLHVLEGIAAEGKAWIIEYWRGRSRTRNLKAAVDEERSDA